jgi:hypothetical protein
MGSKLSFANWSSLWGSLYYAVNHSDFFKVIREKSLEHLESYSVSELIDLLCSFSFLEVEIDQSWVIPWCSATKDHIDSFTLMDLKTSILSLQRLKILSPANWKNAWLNRAENIISSLSYSEIWRFFMFCVEHKISLTREFIKAFTNRMLYLLPDMNAKVLFSLPKVFSIEMIYKDKEFIKQWFECSKKIIDLAGCDLLIKSLYYLGKHNVHVDYVWLSKCLRKVEENI